MANANDDGTWWRDAAMCRNYSQYLFYDKRGPIDPLVQRMCRACPVRNECLNEALERREAHGIWAGTTPATRQAMLRGRSRRTCPACSSTRLDVIGPNVADELVQVCVACALTWPVRVLASETNGRTERRPAAVA